LEQGKNVEFSPASGDYSAAIPEKVRYTNGQRITQPAAESPPEVSRIGFSLLRPGGRGGLSVIREMMPRRME